MVRNYRILKSTSLWSLSLVVAGMSFLTSCKNKEAKLDETIAELGLQPMPELQFPSDNPTSEAKVELGRMLFWDPIVGGEKDMACATCHHPDFGFSDGLDLPIGVRGNGLGPARTEGSDIDRVPRNSPSILNVAFNGVTNSGTYDPSESPMFWDTRKVSLEAQCQAPPTSRSEMRGDAYASEMAMDSVIERIKAIPEYVTMFEAAFGTGDVCTIENYAKALASFERTITAVNSPFDQYIAGNSDAITEQQKLGATLFFGKAKCGDCHNGPMLSDWNHYALGVEMNPNRVIQPDTGFEGTFKFRTPTLRNVELTAPYMHNGMQTTLEEVMEFYVNGKSENPYVTEVTSKFEPLDLTDEEVEAIIEFMKSLTDNDFDQSIPTSVPSGLTPGGSI